MRTIFPCLIFAALAQSLTAHATDPARAAAERNLEAAQIRLRLYEHDEHPRALHRLERAIELTKAQLASHQRRVTEYEKFDSFTHSSPLFFTLEEARLDLRQAELQLAESEEERWLLIRYHSDRARLLQLEVDAAAAELKASR